MKIGILTHPLGANYGGILQNYALQSVLRSLGHSPLNLSVQANPSYFVRIASTVYHSIRSKKRLRTFTSDDQEKAYKFTNQFVDKYINRSIPLQSYRDVSNFYRNNPMDAYIVGSDQVWRGSFTARIEEYFLNFLSPSDHAIRLSYAASFGVNRVNISRRKLLSCRRLLQSFNAVSVREHDAVKICKDVFGVDAAWTVDPTMLLTKKEYIERLKLKEKPDDRVFAYLLDRSYEKLNFIKDTAQKLDTTFFEVLPPKKINEDWENIEECVLLPVETWLESILNSRLIITDSFHGVALSIVFRKPFVCFYNQGRGNSRFETIKTMFSNSTTSTTHHSLPSFSIRKYDAQDIFELDRSIAFSLSFLLDNLGRKVVLD